MRLRIDAADAETFSQLESWRYPPPFDFYDGDVDPVLNPERYFGVWDEHGELVGFYYFEPKPPDLDYGLGLRPDLTGRGLGLEFFLAGLALARERYRPRRSCSTSQPSTSALGASTNAPAFAWSPRTCGASSASARSRS
jgi:ribosomal-protein-alanine N-acetyltransferase